MFRMGTVLYKYCLEIDGPREIWRQQRCLRRRWLQHCCTMMTSLLARIKWYKLDAISYRWKYWEFYFAWPFSEFVIKKPNIVIVSQTKLFCASIFITSLLSHTLLFLLKMAILKTLVITLISRWIAKGYINKNTPYYLEIWNVVNLVKAYIYWLKNQNSYKRSKIWHIDKIWLLAALR